VKQPGPHEREQQQCRQQPCARRRGGPADDDGTSGGVASTGTGRGAGRPGLRHRLRVRRDLLVPFGLGQDRQQLRRPPCHAIVTSALADCALAQVAGKGQPHGSRQHYKVTPAELVRTAVVLGLSQYLPQLPALRSVAPRLVRGSFRGGERGDLEGAQDRVPVLAAQPLNLGHAGA